MSFIFSIKDSYRQAVEAASGGKNTVLYDDVGNPSVMVVIPRFDLADVLNGAPSEPHPAFVVNGQGRSEIFVSKYQNIVHDGRAYSLPMQDPRASIPFDSAYDSCFTKGAGWHLMTNAEWAAVALWCVKNGFQPRGNNDYGKDHEAPYERGKATYTYSGGTIGRVATGSGPASWVHDGNNEGICDLNGNVWEWVDGLRLINGKIWVHQDNNFNVGNSQGDTSGWVDTERYFDNTEPGNDETSSNTVSGDIVLNDERENPMYTEGDVDDHYATNSQVWKTTDVADGVSVPDLLRYLAIMPPSDITDLKAEYLYVRNYGERCASRGGYWINGSSAGLFALTLRYPRSLSSAYRGFRSAFVSL